MTVVQRYELSWLGALTLWEGEKRLKIGKVLKYDWASIPDQEGRSHQTVKGKEAFVSGENDFHFGDVDFTPNGGFYANKEWLQKYEFFRNFPLGLLLRWTIELLAEQGE